MPLPSSFIGLMSGTSLDGVDAVLADCSTIEIRTHGAVHLPFPDSLRSELLALQQSGSNELDRAAQAANQLMQVFAQAVALLLSKTQISRSSIRALGVHGQTLRHRPELGYTIQLNNPALLAELTAIDVVADFRSRDVAAGGQGAPLVPAFHHAFFAQTGKTVAIVNLGGMANLSILSADGSVIGFDTGPGNVLMDSWISQKQGLPFDADGAFANSGTTIPELLTDLLDESYFAQPNPKSTGRDLFNLAWLNKKLARHPKLSPKAIQATLAALTIESITRALRPFAPDHLYACGGGARNQHVLRGLQTALGIPVQTTDVLGVAAEHVEALAFAWLTQRYFAREPGNLIQVTGAAGPRILGALYPA